jgi:hypothetical protein
MGEALDRVGRISPIDRAVLVKLQREKDGFCYDFEVSIATTTVFDFYLQGGRTVHLCRDCKLLNYERLRS